MLLLVAGVVLGLAVVALVLFTYAATFTQSSWGPRLRSPAVTDQLARLDDEVTADEHRSLTVRSRGAVYVVAGVLFGVALLLAALRVGERAGRLSDWQALVLGMTQGFRSFCPSPPPATYSRALVADWRYLNTMRIQQDVRRRPAPGHAGSPSSRTSGPTS